MRKILILLQIAFGIWFFHPAGLVQVFTDLMTSSSGWILGLLGVSSTVGGLSIIIGGMGLLFKKPWGKILSVIGLIIFLGYHFVLYILFIGI